MSDIEWYERTTTTEVTFPATRGTDLTDPLTHRTQAPEWVRLELHRADSPDEGVREWAHVAVYGPRRLKSGELGQEISSFNWQHAYVHGAQPGTGETRPGWLTAALVEQLPEGWSPALLELPKGGGR